MNKKFKRLWIVSVAMVFIMAISGLQVAWDRFSGEPVRSLPQGATGLTYGPELDQFPLGVNPMTGMPVNASEFLKLPAVLMSITNFPASARPQAGLSFAPQVYEIYIGEGMTRFLAVFYGNVPEQLPALTGDLPVRTTPFVKTGVVLGNQVWLDINGNGQHEAAEPGVGGVQVKLFEVGKNDALQAIVTDSNGFYGFNVEAAKKYQVQVLLPNNYSFSPKDAGSNDAFDSDVDVATGKTVEITMTTADNLGWDAGLIPPSLGSVASGGVIPTSVPGEEKYYLGDRVWQDNNGNGLQDANEFGLGGVEVKLLDGETTKTLETIKTNPNGFYVFEVKLDKRYMIQVTLPKGGFTFSPIDKSQDDLLDSDVASNGRTKIIVITKNDAKDNTARWDIGIVPPAPPPVGPGRSARQAQEPIVNSFGPDSCLIAASKDPTVNVNICRYIYGKDPENINSAGVSPQDILRIAQENKGTYGVDSNYSGNLFSAQPPAGGTGAQQLSVFYSSLNQALWKYDGTAGAYLRFEDLADPAKIGTFVPATDRLTGRQLVIANVVILFVKHNMLNKAGTNIELDMKTTGGKAAVLRDGMLYDNLMWTTIGDDFEKKTGIARPVKIRYADKTPFPLAMGNSWYYIATPNSELWQPGAAGSWKYRFINPPALVP